MEVFGGGGECAVTGPVEALKISGEIAGQTLLPGMIELSECGARGPGAGAVEGDEIGGRGGAHVGGSAPGTQLSDAVAEQFAQTHGRAPCRWTAQFGGGRG